MAVETSRMQDEPQRSELYRWTNREGDHVEEVRRVLATGVDINFRTNDGDNVLFIACYEGNFKVARLLVESGVDFHTTNKLGETPLMKAAYGGRPAIIEYLIDLGVDINAQSDNGWTALFQAAMNAPLSRREAAVRVLLDRGINPTLKCTESGFPYTAARNSGPCEKIITDAIAAWELAHPPPPTPVPQVGPSLVPGGSHVPANAPPPAPGSFAQLDPSITTFTTLRGVTIVDEAGAQENKPLTTAGEGGSQPLPPSLTPQTKKSLPSPALNLLPEGPIAAVAVCGTGGPSPKRAGRLGPHWHMVSAEELAADDRESRARSARDLARYRERRAASASAAQ